MFGIPPNPGVVLKNSYNECVLYGTVNNEQAKALHARLEGLCRGEQDDYFKQIYTLKSLNNNNVKLSIIKKIQTKSTGVGVSLMEYQGLPDTQVHEKLTTRTVVRSHVGTMTQTGNNKFLQDLGFKLDFELVMRGKRYKNKQIETTIYKVQKVPKPGDVSSTTDISHFHLVECTVQFHNLGDPIISEFLSFAENLKPLVKLEKYDPNKLRDTK